MEEFVTRFPARFFSRGVISTDDHGLPFIEGETGGLVDGSISLVLRDGRMLKHYFHFMEMIMGAFALHREFFPSRSVAAIYVGQQDWNNGKQQNVQASILSILYPNTLVVEHGPEPKKEVTNAIVLDRSLAGHYTQINKFLEPFLPICPSAFSSFRDQIFLNLGKPLRRRNAKRRACYVKRDPPRSLAVDVELATIRLLEDDLGFMVRKIDFGDLSWEDQVLEASEYDLMIGVHGNGLTNAAWLPSGAIVVEIFPPGCHHYDYQLMSEFFGQRYVGIEARSQSGYIAREFCRFGSPYGEDINHEITDLPIAMLRETLLRVIDR